MFERFTEQLRGAVVFAQEEARSLDHNYIGTEHLLAGLRREEEGGAARALESAGITVDAVLGTIQTLVGRGEQPSPERIPFTPRAKKGLEYSLRESLQLGHRHISTGHLLLGLISQDDSVAVQVLRELGADLGQLRSRVIQGLADDPEDRGEYSPPLGRRIQPTRGVLSLLDTIDERLSAIERHLGIGRLHPDTGVGSGTAGTEAGELAGLKAEADRLRALLREHDIDPEDPGGASAAAG